MTDYKFRDGIQAIVYREINDKREFLILHRIKNWNGWEFPKGGTKLGEGHNDALIRELGEECGILQKDIELILPTNTNIQIDWPEKSWKPTGYRGALYKNFLVKLNPSTKITLEKNDEPEHDSNRWVSKTEALNYLEPTLLKVMDSANAMLDSK